MNRRGPVYPELWILLVVALILLAIAVPYLARGQWITGGIWLLPLVLLIGYVLRGWMRQR